MQTTWQHVDVPFHFRASVECVPTEAGFAPAIILERGLGGDDWQPCEPEDFCPAGLIWLKQLADVANAIIARVTVDAEPPTEREPWSEPHDDGGLAAAFRTLDMGAICDDARG